MTHLWQTSGRFLKCEMCMGHRSTPFLPVGHRNQYSLRMTTRYGQFVARTDWALHFVCLPLCTEQCCPCPRETREFRRTGMAHHARWRTEWILVCDSLFMQSFQAVFDTRVQHLAVWSSSRWQGLLKCTKWTLLYGKSPLQCPHACNDHCVRFLGMKIIYTPKPSTKFEIYVVSGAEEN